jgi:lipoprotein-anchoring transpeptidase ErfK/SrfK
VIDGLRYYFDSNGYRINDLTSVYKGPYYLKVDRVNGVMTVYDSTRTVPVKTIRVSVGAAGTETPLGTYSMTRGLRWQLLMGPSYGQYSTHVNGAGQGGIFVHSVAGSAANIYSLPAAQYNKLGTPASHGCIRTCVADAKWVYENCNGATITIFDGTYEANEAFKGPLGREQLEPLRYPYNYDPTDPAV